MERRRLAGRRCILRVWLRRARRRRSIKAAETDAPGFGFVGVEADELAGAGFGACIAPSDCGAITSPVKNGGGNQRCFDEQHAAHQSFGGAQPLDAELVILECERVTGGELFWCAEEIEQDGEKRLRRAPEHDGRLVV